MSSENEELADDFGDEFEPTPEIENDETADVPADENEPAESEAAAEESVVDDEPDEPNEPDSTPARKQPMIPKARFDEVNEDRKETKRRLAELEARLNAMSQQPAAPEPEKKAPPPTYDQQIATLESQMDALDEKIEDARDIGDREQLNQLRAERKQLERQVRRVESEAAVVRDRQQQFLTNEQARLKEVINDAIAKYPELVQGSEVMNTDAVDDMNTLIEGYRIRGMPDSEAFKKAIAKVAKTYKLGQDADEKPAGKGLPSADTVKSERTKAAIKTHADAANRQPPMPSGQGQRQRQQSSSLDPSRMSEKEFNTAMKDPKLRAKLLGDTM